MALMKEYEKNHLLAVLSTTLLENDNSGNSVLWRRKLTPVNRICNLSLSSELPTHLSHLSREGQE